ncbi:hypothetical protein M408DRAFT_58873, partial [Serendipita vermifera MAFF 305830]
WKPKDETASRRLVHFSRIAIGSLVTLKCKLFSSDESDELEEGVVISCIKLPQLGGYHVTSYDIVKLAEHIVQLRLNTDLKNRARRNMASVACTTLDKVSAKDVPPTNDFITLMQFDHPKPRSIEKSIKVYHWRLLEQCLDKILWHFVS